MSGILRGVRVVPIFLLLLVAAMIAGIGFGHSSDAAHVGATASCSQQVSVGDTCPEHSDAEFCAALCATAGTATPVADLTAALGEQFAVAQPVPAAVAVQKQPSPAVPPPLHLLGVLRI
ncbi:hypothetical protein ACR5MH_0885 (plasmid) [Streptomyces sp. L7]|uniref:hypothetical protein n=1 Tax=Streptomyces sp. L7 TaxID=3423954 RepID=UPI0011C0370A